MPTMPTISPFLWFDDQAEEAAQFSTSVFPGSSILDVTRCGDGAPQAGTGRVMQAMLPMGKLDLSALRAAADG